MAFNTSSYGIKLRLILKRCEKCGIFFLLKPHFVLIFSNSALYVVTYVEMVFPQTKKTKQNKLKKP